MNKKQDGGPAFPCEVGPVADGYMLQTGDGKWRQPGMTLRDHFAGLAMQGIFANQGINCTAAGDEVDAAVAYRIADAMIKVREAS